MAESISFLNYDIEIRKVLGLYRQWIAVMQLSGTSWGKSIARARATCTGSDIRTGKGGRLPCPSGVPPSLRSRFLGRRAEELPSTARVL
jgi:hypothetical protein